MVPPGGDLLEHVKWSAVQIARWCWGAAHTRTVCAKPEGLKPNDAECEQQAKVSTSAYAEGIDCELAVAAAFLHDIGKGGDCAWECMKKSEKPAANAQEKAYNQGRFSQNHSRHDDGDGDGDGDEAAGDDDADEAGVGDDNGGFFEGVGTCFESAYSPLKYDKTGAEWRHPEFGADMLNGSRKVYTKHSPGMLGLGVLGSPSTCSLPD